MCIIAISPKGIPNFPEAQLREMFTHNPDGAGVGYLDNGKVIMKKGFMDYDDFKEYVLDIEDPQNKDIVIHCRITTSGGTSPLNCHPYPLWKANKYLEGEFEGVMFHNGILDSHGYKGEKDNENDTQAFIRKCVKKLPHSFLRNEAICSLISSSIGTNKLLFLSKDGVKMIGNFIEDDGYYYSNASYKPREYKNGVYSGQYMKPLFRMGKNSLLFKEEREYAKKRSAWCMKKYDSRELFKKAFERMMEVVTVDYFDGDTVYYDNDYYYGVDFDNYIIERAKARVIDEYYETEFGK